MKKSEIDLLIVADNVLRSQLEGGLRGFVEMLGIEYNGRNLKVNEENSKIMVIDENSVLCEIVLDGRQLEKVFEFKCLYIG